MFSLLWEVSGSFVGFGVSETVVTVGLIVNILEELSCLDFYYFADLNALLFYVHLIYLVQYF